MPAAYTYVAGQVTLTAGSSAVVGVGTAWKLAGIPGGIIFAEGLSLPLASVTDDTHAVASIEWAGATGTYDYALVLTVYSQENMQNSTILTRLLAELDAGTIFKYDASGDLSGRVTYDERAKGFSYLVFIGVDQPELFVKASATSGDWDGPFPYGTGPKGDTGPTGPAGIANPRGTYASGTAYLKNDVVLYNGSSFVALQATTGNAPPTLPTTANAYWQLTAIKGTDGNGTGDLVGPNGVTDGNVAVFDGVTGKLLKQQTKTQFKTWLATTALDVSFSNGVANLPGNPATVQAAIEVIGNSGGKNDTLLALEIADLKGQRMGMVGGVADSFDDTTGVVTQGIGGIDQYVTAINHFDGTNGATTSPDSSFAPPTWTFSGASTALSSAVSRFGATSLAMNGSINNYAYIPGSTVAFGTGDYTVDCWVRPIGIAGLIIWEARGSGVMNNPVVYTNSAGKVLVNINNVQAITSVSNIAINTWYHVALTRAAGVTRLFINGALEGSVADTVNVAAPPNLIVGGDYTGNSNWNGYFDEFRVTKGVARWVSAFTPPVLPYNVVGGIDSNAITVLHFDGSDGSTVFTDSSPSPKTWLSQNAAISTAQSKFGGASLNIGGTSNRFAYSTATLPFLAFGTGDFTLEAWVRQGSASSTVILDLRGGAANNPLVYTNGSGQLNYFVGGAVRITSTTVLSLTAFTHIAVCRNSGVTRLFINGTQEGVSYSDATNIVSPTSGPYLGAQNDGTLNWSGFIDEVRISNVARYVTNFTPYNVPFFVDVFGSSNFVYDATNDWFSPATVAPTTSLIVNTDTDGNITTLRRYRIRLNPGSLAASGGNFRVRTPGINSGTGKLITNMFIGVAASTGDAWDMEASPLPTRITFAGGNTVRPNTAAPQYSDWINYTIDNTKTYIIAFDMEATAGITRYLSVALANTALYYKDGGSDEAGTPDVSGYTSFAIFPSIDRIEVRPNSADYTNMTLVSVNYTVQSTPSTARVAVQLADALTLSPNTDFSMEVSRDGGNTWSAVTLALTMPSFGGVKMYEGTVSLSGQPTGTTMVWRFKTLTNKNIIASGVVLQQS